MILWVISRASKQASSVGVLREDTDDGIFLVLLLQVLLVLIAEEVHGEQGEYQEERVAPLWAHFPGGDLGGIGLRVPVVDTLMEPVTVVVYVELLKVPEFIQGVVLQVVNL